MEQKEKNELNFTDREIEIIKLLCKGKNNAEIGAELYLSPHTVKLELQKMYKKFSVKNRVSLVVYVIENNIFDYKDNIERIIYLKNIKDNNYEHKSININQ